MGLKTKKWVGFDFNKDGWSDYKENHNEAFIQFYRDFRSDVRKMLKPISWEIATIKKNYFYISGFLRNKSTNNLVYFSISDVRYFQDTWSSQLLIRTAERLDDFTGGRNQYTRFEDLAESLGRF